MPLEHEDLTRDIIGAAIAVHKELGPGFLEAAYDNALDIELRRRSIPFQRQLYVPVLYQGAKVDEHRLDYLVADRIVVELKTAKDITDLHFAIVRSYLRAVQREHALILNFAKLTLEVKRVHAS